MYNLYSEKCLDWLKMECGPFQEIYLGTRDLSTWRILRFTTFDYYFQRLNSGELIVDYLSLMMANLLLIAFAN